jgi:hypothetical protein
VVKRKDEHQQKVKHQPRKNEATPQPIPIATLARVEAKKERKVKRDKFLNREITMETLEQNKNIKK